MKLFELSGATQQSSDSNPALRSVVVNEMRAAAPLLEVAEFYTMVGNSDSPRKAASVAGGAERTLDNDYSGNTTTPSFGTVALKIYGDLIKTDLAHERRGGDIGSERIRQLTSFAKGLGRHIQNHFINGDSNGDAKEFDGLATQIAAGQTINFISENGGQVVLGNSDAAKKSQQMFLFYLDKLINSVAGGASCLMMSPDAKSYLEAIGREYVRDVNIATALNGSLPAYKGVPIINAGYDSAESSLVIGASETLGNSTDCTSVYAVKFGEKENTTFATNVGVQVRDRGLVGVHYTTLVDFDLDLEILNAKSAFRLAGVRLM